MTLVEMIERRSPTMRNVFPVPKLLSSKCPTTANPASGRAIENPTSDAKETSSAVVIGSFVSKALGFIDSLSLFSTL